MIDAVVVTHSAERGDVDACIDALLADDAERRVILVDNGGRLHWRFENPRIELVHTDNRGYGAAVNVGVRRLDDSDGFLIVNDDVVVAPGTTERLETAMSTSGASVAQPMLVRADDIAVVNSLGVDIGDDGAGVDIGDGQPSDAVDQTVAPLAIFTGGAFLASRQFWIDTGGFDERFFLYYEDVDLALRGADLGHRYVVVPEARVVHVGSATTAQLGDRTLYLQERNRLWATARFGTVDQYRRAWWLSIRRLRHEPRVVHARALVAGTVGSVKRLLERRG